MNGMKFYIEIIVGLRMMIDENILMIILIEKATKLIQTFEIIKINTKNQPGFLNKFPGCLYVLFVNYNVLNCW